MPPNREALPPPDKVDEEEYSLEKQRISLDFRLQDVMVRSRDVEMRANENQPTENKRSHSALLRYALLITS